MQVMDHTFQLKSLDGLLPLQPRWNDLTSEQVILALWHVLSMRFRQEELVWVPGGIATMSTCSNKPFKRRRTIATRANGIVNGTTTSNPSRVISPRRDGQGMVA